MRLYAVGTVSKLPCGCLTVATGNGFDHFVYPSCSFDNKFHPTIKGYQFRQWDESPMKQEAPVVIEIGGTNLINALAALEGLE